MTGTEPNQTAEMLAHSKADRAARNAKLTLLLKRVARYGVTTADLVSFVAGDKRRDAELGGELRFVGAHRQFSEHKPRPGQQTRFGPGHSVSGRQRGPGWHHTLSARNYGQRVNHNESMTT